MTRVRLRVRALLAALTALLVVLSGMTLLPAEPAQAAPAEEILCSPGVVYSVSRAGQLRKVVQGSSSDVGSSATNVGSFNGLGIGKDGSPIYAYERTSNSKVEIYEYNPKSGAWSSTGVSKADSNVVFIGGAVDIQTGRYYFGGFNSTGTRFSIYSYSKGSSAVEYVGWTDTTTRGNGGSNGDMAFDANGNLFIVRGIGSSTTIFSIQAANLKAASGDRITSSVSKSFNTNSAVNGVAFDSDGKAYLGNQNTVRSYDMPDWSGGRDFFAGKADWLGLFWEWSGKSESTDLASCSSPATVTLRKNVLGRRAKPGDQFDLSLSQGSTELGSTTTSGTKLDIQEEVVGPLPVKRGTVITFSESGANGADLRDYASSYSCTVDDKPMAGASKGGTSGTVTIPPVGSGDEVVCTITNSPLIANVSIHKDVVDENGENKKPGKDWSVSAKATATTDTVTSTPTAATQKTDTNGDAKWGLKFDKTTGRATISVSETQQDGYEFKSGSCTITGLSGDPIEKKLTSDKSFDLTGIKPGDDVKCSYLNKVRDTSLTLVKKVDNEAAAGTAEDTDWTLKAVGDKDSGNKTIEGKTGSETVTKAKVKAGKYSLSESEGPKGYEASDWVCAPSAGSSKVTSDKSSVTLKAGDDVTCTITNTAKTGAVTWSKTDESGDALKGSVWTLTDPDGKSTEIEDCVAASADKCSGSDKDPAAGKFSVDKLKWGDYTLVEKKAPAGYILDDTKHTFTISGDKLSKEFAEPFENEQKPPVALPLTGGTGSQIYLIGGAALLAAAGAIALLKGLRRRNRKH